MTAPTTSTCRRAGARRRAPARAGRPCCSSAWWSCPWRCRGWSDPPVMTSSRGACSRSWSTCCSGSPVCSELSATRRSGCVGLRHRAGRAIHTGMPSGRIVAGAAAMLLAVPTGYRPCAGPASTSRWVTLAFAQMLYFLGEPVGARNHRRRGRPAGHPEVVLRLPASRPTRSTSTTRPHPSAGGWPWPAGGALAVRLGAPVAGAPTTRLVLARLRRRPLQVMAFVISAGVAGLAGGVLRREPRVLVAPRSCPWTTSARSC